MKNDFKKCFDLFIKNKITKDYYISLMPSVRKNLLEKIIDSSILPFMIATKFKYKSVGEVFSSTDLYSIKNDTKSSKDMYFLFFTDTFRKKNYFKNNISNIRKYFLSNEIQNVISDKMEFYYNNKEMIQNDNRKILDYFLINGSYTTPENTVNKMIENINFINKKILDPCCGRGIFLIEIKKKLLMENIPEEKILKLLNGYDNNLSFCYIAQALIDNNNTNIKSIEYRDSLSKDNTDEFDVIIGNPPYDINMLKKYKHLYYHVGMDYSRELHIAFYLQFLEKLKHDGHLCFISPGRFLVGVNSFSTRDYILKEYNLEKIYYYDYKDVLPESRIEYVAICHIRKNTHTKETTIFYKNSKYSTNFSIYNNKIFPRFDNAILYKIYERMCRRNKFFPRYRRYNIGDKERRKGIEYYKKEQIGDYKNKILIDNKPGEEEIMYTYLCSGLKSWQCVAKEVRVAYFSILEPGIELMHTFYSIPCRSKEMAESTKKYTNSKLFKLLKPYFICSRNSSCWLSNIPMPDEIIKDDNELYNYFKLSEEEINFISSS